VRDYSLRGMVAVLVEVSSGDLRSTAAWPAGHWPTRRSPERGAVAAVLGQRAVADPGYYDKAGRCPRRERRAFRSLPLDRTKLRRDMGVLPGVKLACETGYQPFEQPGGGRRSP